MAEETITVDGLQTGLVRSLQKFVEVDEPEEDDALELMAGATLAGEAVEDLQALMGQGPSKSSRPSIEKDVDGVDTEESSEGTAEQTET